MNERDNFFNLGKKCFFMILILIFIYNFSPYGYATNNMSSQFTMEIKTGGKILGITNYSIGDLERLGKTKQLYSSIDSSGKPIKVLAEGTLLKDILIGTKINLSEVRSIKLYSSDGWSHSYTSDYLFNTNRYYFPNIVSHWEQEEGGGIFLGGAEEGGIATEVMIALKYYEERQGIEDWSKVSSAETPRFCFGQKELHDKVSLSYGKYINKMEVELIENNTFTPTNNENKNDESIDSGKEEIVGDSYKDESGEGLRADTLTIKVGYFGGPYHTKKVFTLEDLERMPQVKQAYTFIDRMPAVVLDSARGVRLTDILKESGIDLNSVENFYFYCRDVDDGWYDTLPKSYLLDEKRYYYPNLPTHWDKDLHSSVLGATKDAQQVDTIIAIEDYWKRFATEPDFSKLNDNTRYRLVFGQTDTNARTAYRSAKWIHGIEVMLGGTPPVGVTLDHTSLELKVGSRFQLSAEVEVKDETGDKRVKWSSSNPEIVSVDNNGRIRVLGEGTATITVSTVVGNKTAVSVINGPKEEIEDFKPEGRGDEVQENKEATKKETVNNLGTDTKQKLTKEKLEDAKSSKKSKDNKNNKESKAEDAGVQDWRVYEMSEDSIALPKIKEENTLNPYVGLGFSIIFLLGGFIKYRSYLKSI